ncbi:MAG: CcmD family protein [Bacteroidia bacterium]|nr:CcmD family protein [Bacteroidia bacterium]
MTKKFYLILFLLSTFFANAQEVEMADSFRADGKIYVVIAVLAIVFTCIIGILIFLERKLSRLEKEIKEAKN